MTENSVDTSAESANQHLRAFLKRLKVTDWITAIGTAVIALATIWNVIEVERSGIDTHNLAVATQNLSDFAEQQAAIDQPRLGVSGMTGVNPASVTPASRIAFVVKNGGKYMARIDSFVISSGVFASFPANPTYGRDANEIGSQIAPPDQPIQNVSHAYGPTPDELNDIRTGKQGYYIFGKVMYSPIAISKKIASPSDDPGRLVKQIANHTMHLCIVYDPVLDGYKNCRAYNDVD